MIQARLGSARLPRKILAPIGGVPMWQRVVEGARRIRGIDEVVVIVPRGDGDEIANSWVGADQPPVISVEVPTNRVLWRYFVVARRLGADPIIRVTADCPLLDPDVASILLTKYLEGGWDYVSNVVHGQTLVRTTDGTDAEIFSYAALRRALEGARSEAELEHVTLYMRHNPDLFRCLDLPLGMHVGRQSVDTATDLEHVRSIWSERRGGPDRAGSEILFSG